MRDYDEVHYCNEEFEKWWQEAIPLSVEEVEKSTKQTYLGYQPTPYEIYIKVLIETFGDQIEDDFSIQLPDGVKELKYQKDAVIQGYQMLMQHNGLFLSFIHLLWKTTGKAHSSCSASRKRLSSLLMAHCRKCLKVANNISTKKISISSS